MRRLVAVLLFAGAVVALAQPVTQTGIRLQDEGVTKGTSVSTLNFAGAGVTCAAAGTKGTCTIPGGGGPGGTDVTGEPFITFAPSSVLTNERVLSGSATADVSFTGTAARVDVKPQDWSVITGKPSTFPATVPVSSASALAGSPTTCGAGQAAQGIVSSGNATGCFTPPGTYTLPDASAGTKGGLQLAGDLGGTAASPTVPGLASRSGTGACGANTWASTLNGAAAPTCTQPAFSSLSGSATAAQLPIASTTLGGVKMAAACGAGNHVSSIDGAGALTCSADSGGYTLPAASAAALGGVKGTGSSTYCTSPQVMSGWDATGAISCATPTGGSGAPTTSQYWLGASDASLPNAKNLGGLSTGLVVNTTGTPSAYGGTSCTNQFPRSLSAAGAATCASVDLSADTAATLLPIAKGGTNSSATATQGGVGYGTGTAHAYSAAGTAGQQLVSGGTGAPTWARASSQVVRSADQNFSSTTGAAITDLTWSIGASETHAFDCIIVSTNSASSLVRFAVAAPTSPTLVAVQYAGSSTSLTATISGSLTGAWASTCTNCTPSVTASVQTGALVWFVSGLVINGANAGSVTLYAAGSAAVPSTIKKGSSCQWWKL